MLEVQRTVYSLEGSINKFLVDDKGLLVLCVFGESKMNSKKMKRLSLLGLGSFLTFESSDS